MLIRTADDAKNLRKGMGLWNAAIGIPLIVSSVKSSGSGNVLKVTARTKDGRPLPNSDSKFREFKPEDLIGYEAIRHSTVSSAPAGLEEPETDEMGEVALSDDVRAAWERYERTFKRYLIWNPDPGLASYIAPDIIFRAHQAALGNLRYFVSAPENLWDALEQDEEVLLEAKRDLDYQILSLQEALRRYKATKAALLKSKPRPEEQRRDWEQDPQYRIPLPEGSLKDFLASLVRSYYALAFGEGAFSVRFIVGIHGLKEGQMELSRFDGQVPLNLSWDGPPARPEGEGHEVFASTRSQTDPQEAARVFEELYTHGLVPLLGEDLMRDRAASAWIDPNKARTYWKDDSRIVEFPIGSPAAAQKASLGVPSKTGAPAAQPADSRPEEVLTHPQQSGLEERESGLQRIILELGVIESNLVILTPDTVEAGVRILAGLEDFSGRKIKLAAIVQDDAQEARMKAGLEEAGLTLALPSLKLTDGWNLGAAIVELQTLAWSKKWETFVLERLSQLQDLGRFLRIPKLFQRTWENWIERGSTAIQA